MTKTIAVSMVRDEADIITATVTNMARHVDQLIVADNGSTDGTRDILADLARDLPLTVVDDPEPAYLQSAKMTRLAHLAGEAGAEWIIPFDADEIWYCTAGRIADHLAGIGAGMMTVTAELFDHMATGADEHNADPTERMVWRRENPLALPKMAARYRTSLTIHQGNHGVDYGGMLPASVPLLVVRHFPYRSTEQFVRKVRNGAAAYVAAGEQLPADAGAHWRQWGAMLNCHGEQALIDLFRAWYWREDPTRNIVVQGELLRALIRDPAPVRR